jgi:chemotaxis family two-component system sensor kinase Cph1
MYGVMLDVDKEMQAEAEILRANQELARSNAELERFAAVVAHDLRSPLFSLSGSAQLLAEGLGPALPAVDRDLVSYIKSGAEQLNQFVQSLLDYARVGHGELTPLPCSMEQILARVLGRLRAALEAAGARLTHDPLPEVRGEETLIEQLLQNLLENALKYRAERPLEVHVGAREEPAGWVFSVRDNGTGIAPEYFERIFRAFERLHKGDAKHAGLGLGLATCKQIVERHKGTIWVESTPGEGSTFHFTLPRIEPTESLSR